MSPQGASDRRDKSTQQSCCSSSSLGWWRHRLHHSRISRVRRSAVRREEAIAERRTQRPTGQRRRSGVVCGVARRATALIAATIRVSNIRITIRSARAKARRVSLND